jgi:hypothetical protein
MEKNFIVRSLKQTFFLLCLLFLFANSNTAKAQIGGLDISLYASNPDGSIYFADFALLNFNNSFNPDVDNDDVRKIMNTYDNLFIKNGINNLVADRRPNLTITDSIKVSTQGLRIAAPYSFVFEPSHIDHSSFIAVLKDNFLQTEKNLSLADSTTIHFTTTADPASRAWDRFVVVFKPIIQTSFKNISAKRNESNEINIDWVVSEESIGTNYIIEQSNDAVHFNMLSQFTAFTITNGIYNKVDAYASANKNWYRVKIKQSNNTFIYSPIVMVNEVSTKNLTTENVAIYPNIIVDGKINIFLKNKVEGMYVVSICNSTGQIIKQNKILVQEKNMQQTIQIGQANKGICIATIIDANGKKYSLPIFVK